MNDPVVRAAASPPAKPRHRSALARLHARSLGLVHAAVGVAVLMVIWELVIRVAHPLPVILPSPSEVALAVLHLLGSAERWNDLLVSVGRVLAGFVLGAISGISIAVLLARSRFLDRSLHYPLVALRFVVPFAWVPIAAYWFALSEFGKVFITWYASFFVIVFQVRAGVEAVPPLYGKVAKTMGMSDRRALWLVTLPAAWPSIVVGLRLGLSFAWVAILAAEMVNANTGIGYFINYSGQFLATNEVMAGMVVIGVLGFCMDRGLGWLGRVVQPASFSTS